MSSLQIDPLVRRLTRPQPSGRRSSLPDGYQIVVGGEYKYIKSLKDSSPSVSGEIPSVVPVRVAPSRYGQSTGTVRSPLPRSTTERERHQNRGGGGMTARVSLPTHYGVRRGGSATQTKPHQSTGASITSSSPQRTASKGNNENTQSRCSQTVESYAHLIDHMFPQLVSTTTQTSDVMSRYDVPVKVVPLDGLHGTDHYLTLLIGASGALLTKSQRECKALVTAELQEVVGRASPPPGKRTQNKVRSSGTGTTGVDAPNILTEEELLSAIEDSPTLSLTEVNERIANGIEVFIN